MPNRLSIAAAIAAFVEVIGSLILAGIFVILNNTTINSEACHELYN
jgi:hypothetical protein